VPVGAGETEPSGEQGGHRAERQQRSGPAADHPFGRVTAGRRPLQALVGQPGLPDPGPAVYHQTPVLA